jgi:hypothetical protein
MIWCPDTVLTPALCALLVVVVLLLAAVGAWWSDRQPADDAGLEAAMLRHPAGKAPTQTTNAVTGLVWGMGDSVAHQRIEYR